MKISPLPPGGMPLGGASASEPGQPMAQRVRALKMATNATPGRVLEAAGDPKLAIPDPSEQTAEVPEATNQPLSPQLAALAKQRRALQLREQAIADKEKALETRPGTQPGGIDQARLKSDPLGVLLEAGVTYDQLTEAVLANNSGHSSELNALKAKLAALEEGFDKKLTDRDTLQKQQALAEMRREALQLAAQGDDFALVRETKNVDQVMKLIERTYDETGEVLDVREALGLIESELVKDSLKLAQLEKVRGQLAPPPAQPQQQRTAMRTLTNRDTASAPMSAKARALAAFHGNLKR